MNTFSVKNSLIGLFVVIALGLITFMLLFLHPTVGDKAKTLRVRFTDIDKVSVGTRVTFAGRPVGEVIAIQEIPDARFERLNRNGDVYVYELILQIDSSVEVFNTDEILLRTSGLLGERSIEIDPQPLKPGEKLKIAEQDILYASQPGSIETTLKQFNEISKKIGLILDDVHQSMQIITENEVIPKFAQSVQNIQEITSALNQTDKWQAIVDNFWLLTNRAHHSWDILDHALHNVDDFTLHIQNSLAFIDQSLIIFKEGLEDFKATAQHAKASLKTIYHVVELVNQGQGNLGQFLVGNELYLRLQSILHKGETAMNDVNQFGLLFHQNKRWQRLQGKRLCLLERLSSPKAFTQYFDREMAQISSSLLNVSVLLNEINCPAESLLSSPEFVERFSELLRRVENMEETLKLYNEQIIEQG